MLRMFVFPVWIATSLSISAQNLWTVSNQGGANADFTNIQAAIDAASPGDKIYVHGSPTAYSPFIISKKLHLVGSGWWKPQNNIPDDNLNPTSVSGMNSLASIQIEADSAIVEGFHLVWLQIEQDNAIVRYNRITSNVAGENPGTLRLANNPNNVFIYGNYIGEGLSGSASNANVFNNILISGLNGSANLWSTNSACVECLVQNNSLGTQGSSSGSISYCTFRNNIVAFTDFSLGAATTEHNIFVDDSVSIDGTPIDSLGNGNIDSVDISTIWNSADPSPDGKWQLIGDPITNVAFGAGINGEDCGAFGGNTPYRLSGIVQIPLITKLLIPLSGDTTNMLNVTIKAKSND